MRRGGEGWHVGIITGKGEHCHRMQAQRGYAIRGVGEDSLMEACDTRVAVPLVLGEEVREEVACDGERRGLTGETAPEKETGDTTTGVGGEDALSPPFWIVCMCMCICVRVCVHVCVSACTCTGVCAKIGKKKDSRHQ